MLTMNTDGNGQLGYAGGFNILWVLRVKCLENPMFSGIRQITASRMAVYRAITRKCIAEAGGKEQKS